MTKSYYNWSSGSILWSKVKGESLKGAIQNKQKFWNNWKNMKNQTVKSFEKKIEKSQESKKIIEST